MRARDTDVLVFELRVRSGAAVNFNSADARARVCVAFDDAPVEHEVARRFVERDRYRLAPLQSLRAGRERDVERVANVSVVRGALACQLTRDGARGRRV